MEKANKKVFKVNYELTEAEKEAVKSEGKKEKGMKFNKIPEAEQIAIIKRIVANKEANKLFNSGKSAKFYLSIYSEGKKEFTKNQVFQFEGEAVKIIEAEQTGSNNEIQLNKGNTLKLSGTSFKLEGCSNHNTLKCLTFSSLTAK